MKVSWNWLKEYVRLDVSVDELAERLSMSGLNHDGTEEVDGDLAIDLEVTSNRPDCLGHIGVAREVAVLGGHALNLPDVSYPESQGAAGNLTSVTNECPGLCPQYIARVVRGVRIGPSPDWMQRRLRTVGINPINNVVDISNYVLLETSQPLHAFDFDKLKENRIVVRKAKKSELITAIDHTEYELAEGMCVIADAVRPVAIAGVMGGFATEVSDQTSNVLVESAEFDPLSIRRTARALNLSSGSSYRFERGVDPAGVDWASRRCCQLIAELCGGEIAEGSVESPRCDSTQRQVTLRLAQLRRLLGIDVERAEVTRILESIGLAMTSASDAQLSYLIPSWRKDLTREIDLIEEVGRIHGYENVPEDVAVPMTTSTRSDAERVLSLLREAWTAQGFSECFTMSFVDRGLHELVPLWTTAEPMTVDHSSRRQENILRTSLVGSLLHTRKYNESHHDQPCNLFEIAQVYLPNAKGKLPDEHTALAAISASSDLGELKGLFESILERLRINELPGYEVVQADQFVTGQVASIHMGGNRIGFLGRFAGEFLEGFGVRGDCAMLEVHLESLYRDCKLVAQFQPVPTLPASHRDISAIVDDSTSWAQLEGVVRSAAGPYLESVKFFEVFRGKQIPAGKKSLHFGMVFRGHSQTLTRDQVDEARQAIEKACRDQLAAEFRV